MALESGVRIDGPADLELGDLLRMVPPLQDREDGPQIDNFYEQDPAGGADPSGRGGG